MIPSDRIVVKIAHMEVVRSSESPCLVTHALGSCIGLAIIDPIGGAAGLLHYMLPAPSAVARAREDMGPHTYASTAIPELFRAAYAIGAKKENLIVCAAGGSDRMGGDSAMKIGARNWTILRKILWKNNVTLTAADVGGTASRNLTIDLTSPSIQSTTADGSVNTLWQGRGERRMQG